MSKNKQMIMISPPMFIDGGNRQESISSPGHRCSIVMATDISGKMG